MKVKDKILDLENRKKIYDFIVKNPGVHQRKIIRNISLSEGTIKYHLDFLVKKSFIKKNRIMGYSRFYPSGKIGRVEKEVLSVIRQDMPRQILIYLMLSFGVTCAQLSEALEKDKKTVKYHIKKLLKLGFIEPAVFKDGVMLTHRYETPYVVRTPKGKEKIYRLSDPYLLYYFYVKYEDAFSDDKVTNEAMRWLQFMIKGVQPKTVDANRKAEDRIIEAIFELFPFPWTA